MNDKEIGQLMNDIVGSVEIEDPEFAFKLLKEALRQAHQEGIEQGKLEGIAEEKKRSIQVVDVNKEVEEIKKQARQDERKKVLEDLKTKGEVISTWMCPTCGKAFSKAWLRIKKRR